MIKLPQLVLSPTGLVLRFPEREATETTRYQPRFDIARMENDDPALAAEIVKRFNAYEDLVVMLKRAESAPWGNYEWLDDARAALKKAGEE